MPFVSTTCYNIFINGRRRPITLKCINLSVSLRFPDQKFIGLAHTRYGHGVRGSRIPCKVGNKDFRQVQSLYCFPLIKRGSHKSQLSLTDWSCTIWTRSRLEYVLTVPGFKQGLEVLGHGLLRREVGRTGYKRRRRIGVLFQIIWVHATHPLYTLPRLILDTLLVLLTPLRT